MITDLGNKKLTTENDDYWIAPDANIIGSVHLSRDAPNVHLSTIHEHMFMPY